MNRHGFLVISGILLSVLCKTIYSVSVDTSSRNDITPVLRDGHSMRQTLEARQSAGNQILCRPDFQPNLKEPGFCASIGQLFTLCSQLEISSAATACVAFDGNFCCYLAQGNTITANSPATAGPVASSTNSPTSTTPTTTTTTTTPTTTTSTTSTTTTTTTTTTQAPSVPQCTNKLDTRCPATQQLILDLVNNVRRQAQAANMLRMVWDSVAAAQAQAWADLCVVGHGPAVRNSTTFSGCGQNIANGNGIQSWNFTFQLWDQEINLFTFGQDPCPDFEAFGHYTQDVWATTFQIGCGFASCPNPAGNFFVCNYCPAGNIGGQICTPYLPGTPANGGVCGKCGGLSSPNCDNGLCITACPFKNDFTNCDKPDASNPTKFPALIPNTSVCSQTGNQFVQACRASCHCRDQGLIY